LFGSTITSTAELRGNGHGTTKGPVDITMSSNVLPRQACTWHRSHSCLCFAECIRMHTCIDCARVDCVSSPRCIRLVGPCRVRALWCVDAGCLSRGLTHGATARWVMVRVRVRVGRPMRVPPRQLRQEGVAVRGRAAGGSRRRWLRPPSWLCRCLLLLWTWHMQWTSVMHQLDSRKGSCASCLMSLETVKFTDGPWTAERGRASAVTAELHDVT